MAEENQEGQKTVVSFIVGLLIGGLLVWAFSGPTTEAPNVNKDDEKEQEADEEKTEVKDNGGDEVKSEAAVIKSQSTEEKATLSVGDGKVVVNDQSASKSITMESATYPVSEGWIGVRDYQNGQLGRILGVVRFSEEQGLVPSSIILLTPTIAGREYAVVVFEESGDRKFNLADDKQIDTIFDTFKAK